MRPQIDKYKRNVCYDENSKNKNLRGFQELFLSKISTVKQIHIHCRSINQKYIYNITYTMGLGTDACLI